jgi:hypothetical protein
MLGLGLNLWRGALNGPYGPAIALSGYSIAEDAIVGAAIGTLSVNNGSGSYTYTITADPDVKFAIDGDALELGATVDYETATSHSVTIEADNGVDPPISRVFTITITNIFEAATLSALTLDADEIEEGAAEDTVVGAIVGRTLGSTLSLTGTASGRFKLTGTNIVAGATATDYETATSHNITIRETLADSPNSPLDTVIAITVTDVDEIAPTITSGATASVDENVVLSHSLTANETVTWSIVGGADQAQFEISGSTLRWASNGTQDYEAPADADTNNTYVVTVRATDTASNTADQTITVTVQDVAVEGPDTGILLETGDFLLAENDDYLIQEAA